MSDLEKDPLLALQKRFYLPLVLISFFIAPAFIPNFLWGESWLNAFMVAGVLRSENRRQRRPFVDFINDNMSFTMTAIRG